MSRSTEIDPTARIDPSAEIGEGVRIGPGCVLAGPVRVEAGVDLPSHVVIGSIPFHSRHRAAVALGGVSIGSRTHVSEFASVKSGMNGSTRIGADCRIGSHVSVGHDCIIEDRVTVLPGARLAGNVRVLSGALIGVGAIVRQRCVIGPFATVAMGAVVTQSVPPLALYVPGKELRQNAYNLPERHPLRTVIGDGKYGDLDQAHPEVAQLLAQYESAVAEATLIG